MRPLALLLMLTVFVAFPTATTPAPADDAPTIEQVLERLDGLAQGELPPEKDYSGTPPWVLNPIDEEDQHVDEHPVLAHVPWHPFAPSSAEPDAGPEGLTADLIRPPQA